MAAAGILLAAALGGGLLFIARCFCSAAGKVALKMPAGGLMEGKTAIITGANSGLGRATAAELLRQGARVIMACRDSGRAEEAARELRAELGLCSRGGGECRGELVVHELDLASLRSVRSFCQQVLQEEPRLDVLINNAGIFQCPYMKTEDGFEMQFGVNHLGHFLLTNLLLGLLKSSAPSRIVVVSSKLYKYGEINFDDLNSELCYNKSFAYSRSKLANIMFTRELARRLENTGVTVNVLHPGIVRTNLAFHLKLNTVLYKFKIMESTCIGRPKEQELLFFISFEDKHLVVNSVFLYHQSSPQTLPFLQLQPTICVAFVLPISTVIIFPPAIFSSTLLILLAILERQSYNS